MLIELRAHRVQELGRGANVLSAVVNFFSGDRAGGLMVELPRDPERLAGPLQAVRLVPQSPAQGSEVEKPPRRIGNKAFLAGLAALADTREADEGGLTIFGRDDHPRPERMLTYASGVGAPILEHHQ